jgi:two-component system sensor histidine kinase KdpD
VTQASHSPGRRHIRSPHVRGMLRTYLGTAPGVGKTCAMLRDARARRDRGEEVLVGVVETHRRPHTIEALDALEVLPRVHVPYHGVVLDEMDLDGILQRGPDLVCVDELAHRNAPGMRNQHRWQDVEALRDAGIDVATTLNVEQLESLGEVVASMTGAATNDSVPDSVIEKGDEVEFIDLAPDALRERVREGDVFPPDMIVAALTHYFRLGNLGALREIGLRLMSERLDATTVPPVGRNVLVVVSSRHTAETLIRQGARIARRYGGSCTALQVTRSDRASAAQEDGWRRVAERIGVTVVLGAETDVVDTIVATATEVSARHVVLGEPEPAGLLHRWRPDLVGGLVEELPGADLHVFGGPEPAADRDRRPSEERGREADDRFRAAELPAHLARGRLRIRLGHAHGCGTTTSMLDEALERRSRGADVVVAAVDTHGHPGCDAPLARLGVLGAPPGATCVRLDTEALLARNPEVACVDDLAAPGVDGAPAASSLDRILTAGITVLATLHVTDLRGRGTEGVPFVDRCSTTLDTSLLGIADEVEVVDATPHDLLDRLRRGEITPAGGATDWVPDEGAPEVEVALRAAAFRLVAEHTDRRLLASAATGDAGSGIRRCVLACVPPRPGMETMIFRARASALRAAARFTVVTVAGHHPHSEAEEQILSHYTALVLRLGGDFAILRESSVSTALIRHARACRATEIVLFPHRGRHQRGEDSPLHMLLRALPGVDLHILGAPPTPG